MSRRLRPNLMPALTRIVRGCADHARADRARASRELHALWDVVNSIRNLRDDPDPGRNGDRHYFVQIDALVQLERLLEK